MSNETEHKEPIETDKQNVETFIITFTAKDLPSPRHLPSSEYLLDTVKQALGHIITEANYSELRGVKMITITSPLYLPKKDNDYEKVDKKLRKKNQSKLFEILARIQILFPQAQDFAILRKTLNQQPTKFQSSK